MRAVLTAAFAPALIGAITAGPYSDLAPISKIHDNTIEDMKILEAFTQQVKEGENRVKEKLEALNETYNFSVTAELYLQSDQNKKYTTLWSLSNSLFKCYKAIYLPKELSKDKSSNVRKS
jgi:hypothetical protein